MFIKEWNSVELSSDQYTEMVFKLKYKELHTYLIGETEPTIETYIDAVQVSFLQSPREGSEFLYLRMMLDRESSTTIVR